MPGHEVNCEEFEHMFISCLENLEECYNIQVSNTSFCECITQKFRLHSQINWGQTKIRGNLLH
jgi:hypothetical protein